MKLKGFLLASILFCIHAAWSQTEPKVVVFDDNEGRIQTKSIFDHAENVFKFGFSEVSRGDFSFYYERHLFRHVSVEFGLGRTFVDYMGTIYNAVPVTFNDSRRNSDLGLSYSLSTRIYFYEPMEGWYVDFSFKQRKYNWEYYHSNINQTAFDFDEVYASESHRLRMPGISVGSLFYLSDHLAGELHVGVRYRSDELTRYSMTQGDYRVFETEPQFIPFFGFKLAYIF